MRSCAIAVILAVVGTALVTEAVIDSLTTMAPKWWDDYMLQNTLVVNEPRQYAPMLSKLDAGEPINVMVWGSSVVAGHAGCGFGRSGRTFIKKARGFLPGCEDRSWQGWGTLFMKWVNETWPSKQHMFANGGLGGAFLTTYVLSGCPEGTIPDPVDLVLLENLGGDTLTKHIEQLLSLIFSTAEDRARAAGRRFVRPAVILLNSFHAIRSGNKQWGVCLKEGTCASECSPDKAGFNHSVGVQEFGLDKRKMTTTPDTVALAQYYGLTVVSLGHMMHTMFRDRVLPPAGLQPCDFFSQFLMDHIHPNQLGKFLYADMLIHAVKDAQRALKRAEDSGEQLPPLRLPPRPMTDKGNLVVSKACYMALQANMTHMMEVEKVPEEYIPIVKNKGWEFVMHDGNPGATWKPGLVAREPGAVLQVRIETAFPDSKALVNETTCYISYLGSYEGRGGVEVKCVSGCKCETQTFDSSHTERVSITKIYEFPISASSSCVLQLKSTKGATGTIFKMTGLIVRAPSIPGGNKNDLETRRAKAQAAGAE